MDDIMLTPRSKLRASLAMYDSDEDTPTPPLENTNAYDRVRKLLLRPDTLSPTEDAGSDPLSCAHVSPVPSNLSAPPSHASKAPSSTTQQPVMAPSAPKESPSSHREPSDSASDLPEDPRHSKRFMALVQRKRQEREAKEAAAAAAAREREEMEHARQQHEAEEVDSLPDYQNSEDESPTTKAPSARKASKKALQEMAKETQRMSRNMQLAHESKTRKQFSKGGLFDCFDYASSGHDNSQYHEPTLPSTAPLTSLSPQGSSGNPLPCSSPGQLDPGSDRPRTAPEMTQTEALLHPGFDLPHSDVLFAPSTSPSMPQSKVHEKAAFVTKRVRLPAKVLERCDDSDSELEVGPAPKSKKPSLFDRARTTDDRSSGNFLRLRQLANVEERRSGKGHMPSLAELKTDLQRKAREQAAAAREERLQDLRARGVILPTAEEMEKDEAAIDDLITKARDEADALMKREKAASKKAKETRRDVLGETYDSEQDADWSEEDLALSGTEAELSGGDESDVDDSSENEEDHQRDDEEAEHDARASGDAGHHGLIDAEASEGSDDETVDEGDLEMDRQTSQAPNRRRPKHVRILSDDEDDVTDLDRTLRSDAVPPSSTVRPMIPGLPRSNAPLLGLTQMFAGSMDESQVAPSTGQTNEPPVHTNPLYMPEYAKALMARGSENDAREESPNVIRDSQGKGSSHIRGNEADGDVSHDHGYQESPEPAYSRTSPSKAMPTQVSEIPDPTQDVGFMRSSPPPDRFGADPPSTIDTLPLEPSPTLTVSPVKRKGRLHRRKDFDIHQDPSISQHDDVHERDEFEIEASAFDALRGPRKRSTREEVFDKKASEARGMVEEQAEESEDEYAGLGGASDEDSGDEEEEQVRDILDETDQPADAADIAAFYADKERASDEKVVQKLYKDITNGTLRKKRGAAYDLSASDDDGEARRAKKRRDFAKMRKALLEDKNVEKIASDPKKAAFLRAIEDRDELKHVETLPYGLENEPGVVPDSQQTTSGSQRVMPHINPAGPPRKRRLSVEVSPAVNKRRNPLHVRNGMDEGAAIRQGLRELIEDPHAFLHEDSSSDEGGLDRTYQHHERAQSIDDAPSESITVDVASKKNPRRTKPVVDRAQLLRAQSTSNNASSSRRMAFEAPNTTSMGTTGFRLPALLRRSTTSQVGFNHAGAFASGPLATTERMAGLDASGATEANKVSVPKRGGQASSSINYFTRQLERKRGLEDAENPRMSKKINRGLGRRTVLSAISGGMFE
ncbi:MAG: hypothetical protein M1817_002355 [Caeruleum heppii]|nr:MAG: hypothetical protein M1817_003460 [Caeruleum heppii]KAI9673717.1 MAG: hypothetical protein M1817_002355 [Caeruleum heppii]